MKKNILIFMWIIILLMGSAVPNQAAEDEPGPARFVKLDSRGQQLARDAGDWAMVLDTSTGLVWEVKAADNSIHDMQAGYDWTGAHETFIAELNRTEFGGFSDWRLPTTEELLSIWVKGEEPNVNSEFFPHTVPSSYMSWRKCGSGEIFDERVKFGQIRNDKKSRQVRAVRGGGVVPAGEKK